MTKLIHYYIAVVLSMTTIVCAVAQPKVLTEEECIDIALLNNPSVRASRLAVERAKALQGTAFDVDATAVTLSQDATGGGSPENGINFSQDFDFPTLYVARHKALKAETALQESSRDAAANELVKNVRSAYYDLLYNRRKLANLQAQDSIYRTVLFLAKARYEEGETSRLELMNAEQLLQSNTMAMQAARNSCDESADALRVFLNVEDDIVPAQSDLVALPECLPAQSVDFATTPVGRMAENEVRLGERNLRVARQGYLPGITVGATTQLLIKGFNPYNIDRERFEKGNFMGFEVGLKVPVFFGATRAKAKAAQKDLEMAKMRREQLAAESEKEYSTWVKRYSTALDNLNYYRSEGVAQAHEMARLAKVSYELGDIGYVEYIRNLEAAAQLNSSYADAINEYNQAVIMLNYLQGIR